MGQRDPLTDAELERVKKVRAVLADGSACTRQVKYAVLSSVGGGWVVYTKGKALAIFREQVRTNTLPATRPFDRVDYVLDCGPSLSGARTADARWQWPAAPVAPPPGLRTQTLPKHPPPLQTQQPAGAPPPPLFAAGQKDFPSTLRYEPPTARTFPDGIFGLTPPQFLVTVGVPAELVTDLLLRYNGDPCLAAAEYAYSTPNHVAGIRVGSHASPSTLKTPGLLWRAGNNTKFSMMRELRGDLDSIKTLQRSTKLSENCVASLAVRVLPFLRDCEFTCVLDGLEPSFATCLLPPPPKPAQCLPHLLAAGTTRNRAGSSMPSGPSTTCSQPRARRRAAHRSTRPLRTSSGM